MLYARFARVVDGIEGAQFALAFASEQLNNAVGESAKAAAEESRDRVIRERASKMETLDALLWELELTASSPMVRTARSVHDVIANSVWDDDDGDPIVKAKLAFITKARADLGIAELRTEKTDHLSSSP